MSAADFDELENFSINRKYERQLLQGVEEFRQWRGDVDCSIDRSMDCINYLKLRIDKLEQRVDGLFSLLLNLSTHLNAKVQDAYRCDD